MTKLFAENAAPLQFSKEHTLITKGILIILMIVHHTLDTQFRNQYQVQTFISNETLLIHIVSFGSMCISGFAFLSAYGMTQSLKSRKSVQWNSCFKWIGVRLIKLESSIFFIYILALLYKRLIMHESISALYDNGAGTKFIYLIIDAFGMAVYFNTPQINITWWYMYFAVLLIITMPFLYMLYDKFRCLLLPVICLLPMAVSPLQTRAGIQSNYAMLLPSAVLGIAFAYEGWFGKIQQAGHKIIKLACMLFAVKLTFDIWSYVGREPAYTLAFMIPLIVFELIAQIPILSTVLKQIGKHATNIFLIHTFIYYYWYTDFIYSFRYSLCIVFGLIAVCMAVSVIIELLKKISGYHYLISKIVCKLETLS